MKTKTPSKKGRPGRRSQNKRQRKPKVSQDKGLVERFFDPSLMTTKAAKEFIDSLTKTPVVFTEDDQKEMQELTAKSQYLRPVLYTVRDGVSANPESRLALRATRRMAEQVVSHPFASNMTVEDVQGVLTALLYKPMFTAENKERLTYLQRKSLAATSYLAVQTAFNEDDKEEDERTDAAQYNLFNFNTVNGLNDSIERANLLSAPENDHVSLLAGLVAQRVMETGQTVKYKYW